MNASSAAIELNWDDAVVESLRDELGSDHIATKAALRIRSKGFSLLGATKEAGRAEGFNWGRSSHGTTIKVLWTIQFTDQTGKPDYFLLVVGATTTYVKCNPYDCAPKDSGKTSWSIQATNDVKTVLGWDAGRP